MKPLWGAGVQQAKEILKAIINIGSPIVCDVI
jgi:hypothetical protein